MWKSRILSANIPYIALRENIAICGSFEASCDYLGWSNFKDQYLSGDHRGIFFYQFWLVRITEVARGCDRSRSSITRSFPSELVVLTTARHFEIRTSTWEKFIYIYIWKRKKRERKREKERQGRTGRERNATKDFPNRENGRENMCFSRENALLRYELRA